MSVAIKGQSAFVLGAPAPSLTPDRPGPSQNGTQQAFCQAETSDQDVHGKPLEGTPSIKRQRHCEYYFSDGNVIILVENTLYRLHRSLLERHSAIFREMWTVPPPRESTEGTTDDNPIILAGISDLDFVRLLWMLYPPILGVCRATSFDEWLSILDQADRWQIESLRVCAAAQLRGMTIEPVRKIVLWARYNLSRNDLAPAYVALIARSQSISLEEAQALGMETTVKLACARDKAHAEGLVSHSAVWKGIRPWEAAIFALVRDIFDVPSFWGV